MAVHAPRGLQPRGSPLLSQALRAAPRLVAPPGCLDDSGSGAAATQQLPGLHAPPGRLDAHSGNRQPPPARALPGGEARKPMSA